MPRYPSVLLPLWTSFVVLLSLGCNDGQLTRAPAPTPEPDWSDVYQQGSTGQVDILWVVDNSGSMGDEQGKLAQQFDQFIRAFVDLDLDFHIAIVTTDMDNPAQAGRFFGTPTVLTPDTPDLVNTFKNNVQVGTNGSGTEMGLEAARTALSEPLLSTANAGFLRENTHLAVIVVSDEDDGGSEAEAPAQDPPADFVRFFHDLTGGDFSLSAVIGDVPNGCTGVANSADAGSRYNEAATTADGLVSSICEEDFGPILSALGEFIGSKVTAKFPTTYEPTDGTIHVWVDGVSIPSGESTWSYDPEVAAVVFAPGAEPGECSEVLIAYARSNEEMLTETPGGTGYDPVCTETSPVEMPEPTYDDSLDGGSVNLQCALGEPGRSSSAPLGLLVLVSLGMLIAIRRRAQ